jgi:hypothetical protein
MPFDRRAITAVRGLAARFAAHRCDAFMIGRRRLGEILILPRLLWPTKMLGPSGRCWHTAAISRPVTAQ